jgi:hypothetical protein
MEPGLSAGVGAALAWRMLDLGTEGALHERAGASARILTKIAVIVVLAVAVSVLPVLLVRGRTAPITRWVVPKTLDAYRGLATWVSIYDRRAWADPAAAVADMAGHGVQTIFIQTGNSHSTGVVYDPSAQQAFISAAHVHGMRIVAWYLPDMVDVAYDYDRIAQAVALRTADGQGFDSFALDIESTAIRDLSARDATLSVLSAEVRALVGDSYPLGAIVPPPVGIAKQAGFWNDFPYGQVARTFDVLMPMDYYTYQVKGAAPVAADASANVRLLRAQPGCADVPIHLIGGLAAKSTAAEAKAFADAAFVSGCIGVSLYSWSGTTPMEWSALRVVVR